MTLLSTQKLILVLVIIGISPVLPAKSAGIALQFIEQTAAFQQQTNTPIQKIYASGQTVKLNRSAFQKATVGGLLLIDLIHGETQELIIQKIISNGNGSLSYIARPEQSERGIFSIITVSKRAFFATIVTTEGNFVVNGQGNIGQLINETKLVPFFKEDVIDTSDDNNVSSFFPSSINQAYKIQKNTPAEISHIGLLVLRTLGTDEMYNGDPDSRINHMVAVTNQIYVDSNVAIQIDLVGIDRVDYDDYASVASDMQFESHPAFEGLHVRRYEAGADFITLIRQSIQGENCGGAGLLGNYNSGLIYHRDLTYSFVAIDCLDYVLAHELGHNLGLSHSRRQVGEGATFPYALGYGVDGNFVTVMAYQQEFMNAQKKYLFSSPELLCNSLPCGIDRNDFVNGADAVYAMNQVREQAAGFYDAVPSLVTIEAVLADNFDATLGECILQTPDVLPTDYAGNLERIFCYSFPISSLNELDKFPHLTELRLYNSSITDLSGLWGLSNIHQLNIIANIITDISPLSSLHYLTNVDLNSNLITDLTPLSELQYLSHLAIGNNLITSIEPISLLPRLLSLGISNNPLSTIKPLRTMTDIRSLRLADNNLTDISVLENNLNLVQLNLSENKISNVAPLKNLTILWKLDLENNDLRDISPLFGLLENNLELLNLAGNNNILCWQQQYMTQTLDVANFSVSDVCSDVDDNNDYDKDGVSNIDEMAQGTSPIVSSANTLSGGGGSLGCEILLLFMWGASRKYFAQ